MIRLIWSYIMKWGWNYNRDTLGPKVYHKQTNSGKYLGSFDAESNDFVDPIRFSVTPANGGVVVTVRTYDKLKDRSKETIHVIHEDTDYAKAVGDIVAMEILKS